MGLWCCRFSDASSRIAEDAIQIGNKLPAGWIYFQTDFCVLVAARPIDGVNPIGLRGIALWDFEFDRCAIARHLGHYNPVVGCASLAAAPFRGGVAIYPEFGAMTGEVLVEEIAHRRDRCVRFDVEFFVDFEKTLAVW